MTMSGPSIGTGDESITIPTMARCTGRGFGGPPGVHCAVARPVPTAATNAITVIAPFDLMHDTVSDRAPALGCFVMATTTESPSIPFRAAGFRAAQRWI